jgi:hypothetical protein
MAIGRVSLDSIASSFRCLSISLALTDPFRRALLAPLIQQGIQLCLRGLVGFSEQEQFTFNDLRSVVTADVLVLHMML